MTTAEAASVTLNLDHVLVECANDGNVLVKCFDAETMTLSVWVMRKIADGWYLQSTAVPVEPCELATGSISIH